MSRRSSGRKPWNSLLPEPQAAGAVVALDTPNATVGTNQQQPAVTVDGQLIRRPPQALLGRPRLVWCIQSLGPSTPPLPRPQTNCNSNKPLSPINLRLPARPITIDQIQQGRRQNTRTKQGLAWLTLGTPRTTWGAWNSTLYNSTTQIYCRGLSLHYGNRRPEICGSQQRQGHH